MKELHLHLLIDDVKNLNADIIARNYKSGVLALLYLPVTHLYIDHDLGEENSGYDILKFFKVHYHRLPNFIQLVSSNPVGKENMKNLLISMEYITKDGYNFYK